MCNLSASRHSLPRRFSTERKNGIMRVRTLRDSLSSCSGLTDATSTDSVDLRRMDSDSLDGSQSTSVRFSEVRIREYAVTIGDNPSCSSGAPVSLDWVHSPLEQSFDVEAYEEARGPQRPQSAMKMPCHVRHNLLMDEWEYSMYAVMTAQEETSKIREQRMKTSRKARKAILREESIGAMKKSLKKFFTSNIRSKKDKQESRDILFGKDRQLAMVLSFGSDNSSDESSSDEEI